MGGVPTLVLTDADSDGLLIALTYASVLPANSFRHLGARPSDRRLATGPLSGISTAALIPLSIRERALALAAVDRGPDPYGGGDEVTGVLDEMVALVEGGVKFEIEALITIDASGAADVASGGLAAGGLVAYVESRIAEIMGPGV
jgi:hypothetical protein